jgi:hypothetical protein
MGLDVSFYEKATVLPEHEKTDDCWDEHVVAWCRDFPAQADGIPHKACLEVGDRGLHIHHSYSGYNRYRAWLCMAAVGVPPEVVWENPDNYIASPFLAQIHFADNEGIIGPKTARVLADAYADNREAIRMNMRNLPQPFDVPREEHKALTEQMMDHYDRWAAGFALAADTGVVRFG